MSYVSYTQNLCQHLPFSWLPLSFIRVIGSCCLLPHFNQSFPLALITPDWGELSFCTNLVLTFLNECLHQGETHTTIWTYVEEGATGCKSSWNSHCTKSFFLVPLNVQSFFLFFFPMVFLPEYFLQSGRLELFKATVPSVSSPSYFKINHSPSGNE